MDDQPETRDDSHQREFEMLMRALRALGDLECTRADVGARIRVLHQQLAKLEERAALIPAAEGERTGVEALQRKAERKLSGLTALHEELRTEEDQLRITVERLKAEVAAREAIDRAAEAQSRVSQVWSAVPEAIGQPGASSVYSDGERNEVLRRLQQSIRVMADSRTQLDRQILMLAHDQEKLGGLASQASGAGRGDLAQLALAQKATIDRLLPDLVAKRDSLRAYEQEIKTALGPLQAKAEVARVREHTARILDDAARFGP